MAMEKKFTILIVDDSSLIIERLVNLLNETLDIGKIAYRNNYEEGKKLLETEAFDVILLDISMPGRSGLDLLRFIKRNNYPITVIVMTNESDPYYRRICNILGADYYFDKFKDFEKIPVVISQL